MQKFLFPSSIVVVGVSSNPKKVGHTIAQNIISSGFRGKLYFVNRGKKSILGKRAYQSIVRLPHAPDLAIVAIPALGVAQVLEDCAKLQIKNAIIISAGFSESGVEGRMLEEKMVLMAKKRGIQVLGPNCLGILNSENHLNASFADAEIEKGGVGFLSQSGAIGTAMLDWAAKNHFGFSQFLSLGNMAMIDETQALEYFWENEKTKVILAYLEGIKRGVEFFEKAKKISEKKPIIVLKAGITKQGHNAVFSHTGSMAGDERIFDEAAKKANIIRAKTLEEFFNLAVIFCSPYSMRGKNVAIVTNAGGAGVVAADIVSQSQLELAQLTGATAHKLRALLPSHSSVKNPVDIVGDADAERYEKTLDEVLKDTNVDAGLVLLTPQTMTEVSKTAKAIVNMVKKRKIFLSAVFLGAKKVVGGIEILQKASIPVFTFPHQAIDAMEKMCLYFKRKKKSKEHKEHLLYKKIIFPLEKYEQFQRYILGVRERKEKKLSYERSQYLLQSYKIPLIPARVVREKNDIAAFAKDIQYPMAAKIFSADVEHKTDLGGVVLHIKNLEEAKNAFQKIKEDVSRKLRNARIDGVLFQEMAREGIEMIFGAKRDPQFGPVVLLGMGGIYTEIFQDTALRLVPIGRSEPYQMIDELRISPIVNGTRGQESYDKDAIADVVHKLSQLMTDFPDIQEIDINPAIVYKKGQGVQAVDWRIMV